MGLFRRLLGRPRDLGNVALDDVEAYWRIDDDLARAGRCGDDAVSAALGSWGLRDRAHAEAVKAALLARHRRDPAFAAAGRRVHDERRLAHLGRDYRLPDAYARAPHGVTIERYAAIKARLELGQPLDRVLAELALDRARWGEVERTWTSRMGPSAEASAGQFLRATYAAVYHQAVAARRRRP